MWWSSTTAGITQLNVHQKKEPLSSQVSIHLNKENFQNIRFFHYLENL